MKAAIIGGGVIGGGWAARFALNGWDVTVFDPDPQAQRKIGEVLANARRALPSLYDRGLPAEGAITFCDDIASACLQADWVQESVPERLDIKHHVLAEIAAAAPPNAVIGSSTSGFRASELAAKGARVIVAHPFNPVYLLPLVELVGEADHCRQAADILVGIGMFPLTLRKEIDAHIADRLLEAVWREALWLIKDDIATTEEIDEAIRMGFGLRWAQMGLFETYRIAGGEAGMKHFLAQFGPTLAFPWSRLTDVPEYNDHLVNLIAGQSDAQSGHRGIRDLERVRDDNLVGFLRLLKGFDHGAGQVVKAHEETLADRTSQRIPATWADYNGHMNETHYVEIASRATDRFMEEVGADASYVAGGSSYFTVENHVRYLDEVKVAEKLTVATQTLGGKGKKLHLFHTLTKANGSVAATIETLLVHVDLTTRRASDPAPHVAENISARVAADAHLPWPRDAGRSIGS